MADFFCRLIPPRPSFASDMTEQEAKLMQKHAVYWKSWMAKGCVIAFGFVGDPGGAYGVGIVAFPDDAAARSFTDSDPVIAANAGFRYEVLPMPLGAVHRGSDG